MKIGIVTDSYYPTRDGVVTAVVSMRKILEDLGHTVVLLAPDPGEEFREENVQYFRSKKFKRYPDYFLPIYPSGMKKRIKELDLDIVHIYGVTLMSLKALICVRTSKIPFVVTYVTNVADAMKYYSPLNISSDFQAKLVWIYLRKFLKRPDCVVALTHATLEEFEKERVCTKRTEIIPIGIDIHRFRNDLDGSSIRDRYNLQNNRVAIYVGRISYEKNIEVIIQSVKHLEPDIKLLIVGKGPALSELQALAEQEGISDRIIFTGFVSDEELPLHYVASDVVVSASRFETQGLTIVEAMSCGIPAACSDGRAFLDVIQNGYNGYLFDGTSEGCAEAISNCLNNLQNLEDNLKITSEAYSIESIGNRIVDLYESVLKDNS